LAAVAAAIVAWIYGPLTGLAERLAERLMPRSGYNMDDRLSEYSLAIGNIIDLDQLATVIVGTVSEVLDVQRAALIVVTEENDEIHLRPLKGMGDIPLEEISFGTLNPMIEHMEAQQRSLFHYDIEHDAAFRGLLPQIQAWLEKMGMEVYVPIVAKSILIGILAAGPPRSGEPFGHRDRTFLNTLAGQTSVALQNASMFEGMRELNLHITRLNKELRQAMERVERLDRAKSDFLTVASHELRTPLTHMKGYTHLLEELHRAHALTPEQTLEVSHSIGQAVDRLETIVSAIVDMSQLDRNELDTVFSSTTLKAVLRLALEQWVEPIKKRRLHLSVKGVEDIPPIVADLERLSQAFGNLVSNAIKFTPDGGAISIHAHQTDEAHLEVIVSDTGVGISPQDQVHIFDQFFRVGSADRHSSSGFEFKGGGPGLGLAIARGIIEAHGGRIWVESQGYDEIRCPGSEFHVVLPLQAAPAAAEPSASASPFTVAPQDL
jgi:signal transduction histidine kinase